MTLELVLRIAGGSLVVLALFHMVLWRSLGWSHEMDKLSPLSARVFAVHTFFVALVLCALGLLSLVRADLLLAPSELGRLLLGGVVVFWVARLVMQPLIFDRAMRVGWVRTPIVRFGANAVWVFYVAVYVAAFLRQLGRLG